MLISYPVLPASAIDDDEDKYLENILNGYVLDSEGTYPVSSTSTPTGPIHRWHGGIHMRGNGEPIRAIADGTVVAYRFAPACETYEGQGDYDTSFVLIHHETETGESTKVEFYSLYMHLANRQDLYADRYTQLPDWMKQAGPSTSVRKPNRKIWRKDVLGFAGKHYNREAWHFEVFTTDQAFNAFWRDSISQTEGSGSNDFFGDAHFVIPVEQSFRASHPHATPHGISFGGSAHFPLETGQDGANEEALYVSVQLAKGQRVATTYARDAQGKYKSLGLPVKQDNYEYELYRLATALYPDCPSAGYEWLRFGRVLGPDGTTRNENWQLIRYASDRTGYIDLAPDRIVKLSDADFPFWHGWEKRSQGQLVNVNDGLCNDETAITLTQANDDASQKQSQHLICMHPSEWDASDLATRYAALREPDQPLHDDEKWGKFEQHVQKLAFWAEAGLPERGVWHFHPLQFVRHLRNCGWLSKEELAQCIPRTVIEQTRNAAAHIVYPQSSISWDLALSRVGVLQVELNRTTRKYCISSRVNRLAAFLGNSIQETIYFSRRSELAGAQASYAPWYGRGLLQLTHRVNYDLYRTYKGWSSETPESILDTLEADVHRAADSAGFYWVSCAKPITSAFSINKFAERPLDAPPQTLHNVCAHYNYPSKTCSTAYTSNDLYRVSPEFEQVARAVNTGNPNSIGAVNGLIPRSFVYAHCFDYLSVATERFTLNKQRAI